MRICSGLYMFDAFAFFLILFLYKDTFFGIGYLGVFFLLLFMDDRPFI